MCSLKAISIIGFINLVYYVLCTIIIKTFSCSFSFFITTRVFSLRLGESYLYNFLCLDFKRKNNESPSEVKDRVYGELEEDMSINKMR